MESIQTWHMTDVGSAESHSLVIVQGSSGMCLNSLNLLSPHFEPEPDFML